MARSRVTTKSRTWSLADLQKVANQLSQIAQVLLQRLVLVQRALTYEKAQVHMYRQEVRDSERRMDEVQAIIEDVEADLATCTCMEKKLEFDVEMEELVGEKSFEAELLADAKHLLQVHEDRHAKLMQSLTSLRNHLLKIRRKQQVLLFVAVRLGLMRLPHRKLASIPRITISKEP